MFSELYYTIFPEIGEFFGKLVAFVSMDIGTFLSVIDGGSTVLTYVNLFNGLSYSYTWTWVGGYNIFAFLLDVLFLGIPSSYPLWLGILMTFAGTMVVVSIIKFIFGKVL